MARQYLIRSSLKNMPLVSTKAIKTTYALYLLLLLTAGSVVGYVLWQKSLAITVDVGPYPTQRTEEKAALQRLSLELLRHPKAQSVRILAGRSFWRRGVMGFARVDSYGHTNVFWNDNRFSSAAADPKLHLGITADVLMSEVPIHEAAIDGCTVDDVILYDEQLRADAHRVRAK